MGDLSYQFQKYRGKTSESLRNAANAVGTRANALRSHAITRAGDIKKNFLPTQKRRFNEFRSGVNSAGNYLSETGARLGNEALSTGSQLGSEAVRTGARLGRLGSNAVSTGTRKSYNAFKNFIPNQKERWRKLKNSYKGRSRSELAKTIKNRAKELDITSEKVRKLGKYVEDFNYDEKYYNKASANGDTGLITKYKSRVRTDKKNIQTILRQLPHAENVEMADLVYTHINNLTPSPSPSISTLPSTLPSLSSSPSSSTLPSLSSSPSSSTILPSLSSLPSYKSNIPYRVTPEEKQQPPSHQIKRKYFDDDGL